jgi:RNA polymerase sigma factor (sigma-70 family)
MGTSQRSEVVQHLRRAALLRDGAGLTDGQLLEDYLGRHDEAALAALVRRHGPMVWGVCRRVLGNHHDAEDAFQATFLVLVRKAASIASRELLANWLYGVAHQTALKARTTAAKRKGRERQVAEMPEPAVEQPDRWNEVQPLLDEELGRLPARYRGVLVLCDLEGKTRKEVAVQLGCPEGTVASRLARARALLANRLTRRGVTLSGGAVAAVLARQAVAAGVPGSVVDSTINAARLLAAGRAAATGAISVKVAALTEGVLKAMLLTKLRAAIAVVLLLGVVATGATLLTCRTAAGQDDKKPPTEKPVRPAAKPEKEQEIVTAWGQEVGGLQAGLGLRPGEHRVYHHGETITLVVRVRNVGKETVRFEYLRQFLDENPPTVTAADGKTVPQVRLSVLGEHGPVEATLEPGEEIELESRLAGGAKRAGASGLRYGLGPAVGTGRVTFQYERVLGNSSAGFIKLDPTLSKLATGKLELEVKEPEKVPESREKEGFTAWGQEVGGLQAGLGFRPGEPRVYHHGETVTLAVRVRNVGKETVKFEYLRQFLDEEPPTVTAADGKTVPQHRTEVLGFHAPVAVSLAPGQETELESRIGGASGVRYELRPASARGKPSTGKFPPLYVGTGKVGLQYERVLGNSSAGQIQLDPHLSKLGTGKLELEVKPAPPTATEKK